jgi:excisionase family DNA binding protein
MDIIPHPSGSPRPLAPTYGATIPLPAALASFGNLLAPIISELDQFARRAAREEYAKLLAETEAATAEARRNEEPLTVKQVAELLNVTPQTAWEWYKRDLLNGSKIGGRLLFRRGDVLAALQAQTQPDGRRKYARKSTKQKGR